MAAGIACGAAAGALWGLIFLAPRLAGPFNPVFQAAARYLAYGVISVVLLAPQWRRIAATVTRREWLALAWLGIAGNTLYYILVSTAVRTGGTAMTALVCGFMPVAVTLIGSRDPGSAPLRRLVPSLLLCIAGAVCIGWQTVAAPSPAPVVERIVGLLCAVGALVSWTAYAVGNSRWLTRLGRLSVRDWTLLTGIMAGAQSLFLFPLALVLDQGPHDGVDWARLVIVSIGVAILASIAGNAFWNRMCRLLPLTLVGQMILFETLFAQIYGFLWERRLPAFLELAAFVLVASSVLSCVAAHRRKETGFGAG
ncbi:MAG: DMT family transporter [Telmatospirillum sp.]|nr:DMT family transporter [Telmatospirillum sp.]